jgi:hypothetical protein
VPTPGLYAEASVTMARAGLGRSGLDSLPDGSYKSSIGFKILQAGWVDVVSSPGFGVEGGSLGPSSGRESQGVDRP